LNHKSMPARPIKTTQNTPTANNVNGLHENRTHTSYISQNETKNEVFLFENSSYVPAPSALCSFSQTCLLDL
jgi:hypothetical protein